MNPALRPHMACNTSASSAHQIITHKQSAFLPALSWIPPSIPNPPRHQSQCSLPITLKPSSPAHLYCPITHNEPMPNFWDGQNQFPPAKHHFWHPSAYLSPNQYERLPGEFSDEDFLQWWRARSWHIDNHSIIDIQPETEYEGIHYRVTMHPSVWENYALLCGDSLIFWGMDHDNIKYIITWTLNKNHDNDHAYVQVNAFNQFQGNLDSSDVDWPALGFLVPKSICDVIITWPPPMLANPFEFDAQSAPHLPELHPTPFSPVQHHWAHVWENPLPGLMHFSKLNVLTHCKKFLVDNKE